MIKGTQIFLRELEPDDVDLLFQWENDTENWQVSNTSSPFSRHILEQYVNSVQDIYANRQLRFMICIQDGNRPVGAVDFFDFDPKHQRVGVGILIGHRKDRQKGYAKDALATLIKYGFEVLDLHQFYCNIMPDNERSLQLFQAQGFKITGTKKDWVKVGEHWVDEHFLQLIRQ